MMGHISLPILQLVPIVPYTLFTQLSVSSQTLSQPNPITSDQFLGAILDFVILHVLLTPGLIESTFAYIPHPLNNIVVTVVQLRFKHFQVAYFETRRCERDLDGKKERMHM